VLCVEARSLRAVNYIGESRWFFRILVFSVKFDLALSLVISVLQFIDIFIIFCHFAY
jgi:hypothetical protein